MSEYKKVVTKLESNVKPISIDAENATQYAKAQNDVYSREGKEPTTLDAKVSDANLEEFHAVNDVIKLTKKKTPIMTYVIMILILVILVAIFIIFELPMLRGL